MISVCIATYNGSKYIKQQIDSIISQLESEDEIVISDDSSTDETVEILKSYGDPRIKIIHFNRSKKDMSTHVLVSSNFENALKHSSGDLIFLSDQDDLWASDKVEVYSKYLRENDLVISDCCLIIDDIIEFETSFFQGRSPKYNYLLFGSSYHGCCMAFNRKILNISLPFPRKLPLHDAWLGLLAESLGKVKFLHKKLTYYRVHTSNVSIGKKNKYSYKIYYRLYVYGCLIKRLLKIVFIKNY